jgi:hypothetical protein
MYQKGRVSCLALPFSSELKGVIQKPFNLKELSGEDRQILAKNRSHLQKCLISEPVIVSFTP